MVMLSIMAVLAALSLSASCQQHSTQQTAKSTPAGTIQGSPDAATIYANNCAACHGPSGHGDGAAAYLLYPKPRNFSAGVYRFKSTPEDQPPTAQDVARVIREGIPRTAMPPFALVLRDEEIEALVPFVLGMGNVTDQPQPTTPIAIAPPPAFTSNLITQGRLIYQAMGCGACHGETGRGDGPSSATLKDSDGYPLPAADFTTGVFKAGRQPVDLYRTIMVGVPGTPMPSFARSLGEANIAGVEDQTERTWALVAYLQSLITHPEPTGVVSGAALEAFKTSDEAMLNDPIGQWNAWDRVPSTVISLQPLWQRKVTTRSVVARAVQTENRLALCLDWADETMDGIEAHLDRFSDAASVMFGLGMNVPPLWMGQQDQTGAQKQLVNLWQWKASRQIAANDGRLHDVANLESGSANLYMFKKGDLAAGPITEHDPTFITAWGAHNPQADPALMPRSILESNAGGFGTLTVQAVSDQNVVGVGTWANGRWRVVMIRQLQPNSVGDVDLTAPHRIPVAFALWQGSAGDRNGTKLISGWHWLVVHGARQQQAGSRP